MGAEQDNFDVVSLGAGPGGYVAAIRSAQEGFTTAIVEQGDIGGICLRLGCVPSKAMRRVGEIDSLLREVERFGVVLNSEPHLDYGGVLRYRNQVVDNLAKGLDDLLQSNRVTVIKGRGRLRSAHELVVGRNRTITFKNLVIATGSHPFIPPIKGTASLGVIDSDGALALTEVPKRPIIIGGGAIGVEWAQTWKDMGVEQVVVIEQKPQLVPNEEGEIGRALRHFFDEQGIDYKVGVRVLGVHRSMKDLEVTTEGSEQTKQKFTGDVVLVSTGRRANVEDLGLENVGVDFDEYGIYTNRNMRTNVRNIFAVGDVNGKSLLAHVAAFQGEIAVNAMIGHNNRFVDERAIPAVTFTDPEIASIGIKEVEARQKEIEILIGRFPFSANGRAQAHGEPEGFVKIIASSASRRILGTHIIGPMAGELIMQASLAMKGRLTLEDIIWRIYPHPTFSEAFREACMDAAGTPLHIPIKRRRS